MEAIIHDVPSLMCVIPSLICCMPCFIYLCNVLYIYANFYLLRHVNFNTCCMIIHILYVKICTCCITIHLCCTNIFIFCCIVFSHLCCINTNICCINTTDLCCINTKNLCCIKICQRFHTFSIILEKTALFTFSLFIDTLQDKIATVNTSKFNTH